MTRWGSTADGPLRQTHDSMSDVPVVFPRPRYSNLSAPGPTTAAAVVARVDATLPAQGYEIVLAPDSVRLAYADEAGRRYGLDTLEQLRRAYPQRLPGGMVSDHPDFAVRGYMLDISRDRVPTRACLDLLVKRLGALRYNHLQLYTEHTFAYVDHEVVWRDASPMTADDMAWLDQRCADVGIELAANQNTFGHMERWLAHDRYRGRAETPRGFRVGSEVRPPTALAPTEPNARFAVELVRELSATIRGDRVNIGCDEVWELGQGASRAEVDHRGRATVFVEHVRRIAEPLLADGLAVQFWSDMVQAAPEAAAPLAEAGAIAAVWSYEAPLAADPDEIDLEALPERYRTIARDYFASGAHLGFGPRLESFASTGFATWVVPGTGGWNSFVGRLTNARGNLADAARAGREHGAEGLMVTEWGDHGHHQPPFSSLPALVYGAGVSWCEAANRDLPNATLAAIIDRLVDDPKSAFGAALVGLGTVVDTLRGMAPNGAPWCYALVEEAGFAESLATLRPEHLDATRAALATASRHLAGAQPKVEDGELLVRETLQSARLVDFGLDALVAGPGSPRVPAELVAEQRACWLARSRPGGLEDSLGRLFGGADDR